MTHKLTVNDLLLKENINELLQLYRNGKLTFEKRNNKTLLKATINDVEEFCVIDKGDIKNLMINILKVIIKKISLVKFK